MLIREIKQKDNFSSNSGLLRKDSRMMAWGSAMKEGMRVLGETGMMRRYGSEGKSSGVKLGLYFILYGLASHLWVLNYML